MQAYFISDLHLKKMEERNSQKLLRFLLSLWQQPQGSVTHLCFLGDIFDVWVGGHDVFVKRWNPILKAIDSLRKKHRTQVFYLEGNHDMHIAPFWEKRLKATVLTEPLTMPFGPWIVHMAHGDLINTADKDYLRFRKRVRSPFMRFLAHNLPGSFWDWAGKKMSEASARRSRSNPPTEENHLRTLVRDYAKQMAERDLCQFVITGHFHIQDDYAFSIDNTTVHSINLGTWSEGSQAPIYRIDDKGGAFIET